MPRWTLPSLVFAATFAFVYVVAGYRSPQPPVAHSVASVATVAGDAGTGPVVWSHGPDGSAQNAEGHWRKHGRDFPELRSAAEYARAALEFVRNPPAGTLVKHRINGDTLLYDPRSNTFAVADVWGEPRTFFRPDSGRGYWERQ
ncbi:MAG TPA: hypothetical protein VG819_06935 [Rhizomicrobium sp.]|jgi:filamentous hemagglutinin|nr:hypothetical protein [Rhizomicrobium sp.]